MAQPALTRSTRVAFASLVLFLLLFPWASVLLLCLAQAVFPHQAETYGLYSFVVGIVLLGLPHGALDHLVPTRMGFAWAKRPPGLALYLLAYVAIAALYFGSWLVAPLVAFLGFLTATIFHWGQGDVRFLEIFLGRRRPNRFATAVSIMLRGSLPIVIPILAFPATAESLYRHAAKGLGLAATHLDLSSPLVVGFLSTSMLILLALYAFYAVQAAPNRTVLWIDALELVLLAVLFCSVPAYMSVGIYFIVWHSLRHLARLLVLQPGQPLKLETDGWARPLVRMALELVPITLAALSILVGLYLWKVRYTTGLETFVALYLVMISALTKPHLVLTVLMDYAPRKEQF
jgi:beta-carotene 15,15'-dioxygenase